MAFDKATEDAIVRRWMRDILSRKDWSPERWACEAGIAPTTITRFLNKQSTYMPSTRTIARLVEAANCELPPLSRFGTPHSEHHRVPIIDAQTARRDGIDMAMQHAHQYVFTQDERDDLFAIELGRDTGDMEGASKGCIAIGQRHDTFDNGTPVIFLDANDVAGVARLYDHLLIPASSDPHETPINWQTGDVLILGRVLETRHSFA